MKDITKVKGFNEFPGTRIGDLVAIKLVEMKAGKQLWLFQCLACGEQKVMRKDVALVSTTCGCGYMKGVLKAIAEGRSGFKKKAETEQE